MNVETMLDLTRRAAAKVERVGEIRAKAEAEGRDLSRRERVELDRIREEMEALQRQLPPQTPGQAFQAKGVRSGARKEREPDLLKPGDSFAEAVRERRGGYTTAGAFGEDGYDEASLGKVLGSLLSGDRSGLNEAEQRALGESAGSGQYLVAPELSSAVVDAARAQAVAFRAGCMTMDMGEPITYIPRLDTPVEANWHVENEELVRSDQAWSRITLQARTVVAGPLLLSREIVEDTDGTEIGTVIADDLAKVIARAIDKAVFEGAGVDDPLGVVNTANINELAMPGTDGATPSSYDDIVKAVYAIQAANGPMATAAVMHPTVAEGYALLADSLGQPLRRPQAIADLPFLSTSELRNDRTVGSSDNASNIYVGDFSQVVVAFRPSIGVRALRLEERWADTLSVGLVAYARLDVGVRRPEFLSVLSGVLPPA